LTSVSASSTNDVWAVGSYQREYNPQYTYDRALTLHWNGSNWQSWFAPNPGVRNRFDSVVAIAPNNAWAAGAKDQQILLEHWDGLSWNYVSGPVPDPIPYGQILSGITAVSNGDLWGVGIKSDTEKTLTVKYPGPCLPTTPTPTPTACPIQFSDVSQGSTFYEAVRCLVCRGIASGYGDGTYRPSESLTRGQLAKLVSNSAGFMEGPSYEPRFQDVLPFTTFYLYIQRLANRGYVSGYACGGPDEPCVAPYNLPYFRPSAPASRGQSAKIISDVALFNNRPSGQAFADAPVSSPFYTQVERLSSRYIISGYPCGEPGEPCIAPDNKPYFRPGSALTRGQVAQILTRTFFPGCITP
jgi:hypothetical protein